MSCDNLPVGSWMKGRAMARPTAYVFCRYAISEDGAAVSPDEEWELLQEIKGKPIAYRKSKPKPDDHDTYLMVPRRKSVSGYTVHTWAVAQDVKTRERSRYDKRKDEIKSDLVDTEEIK